MDTDISDNISVVIPAYNAAGTIGRALDSVIAQTHPAREIIVVDDGSTDRTAQIVSEYGGRVEYLYQDNAGPGAARNAGIRAARGEWIAFLDADDEWLPHRLALQVDLLGRHPDLAWVTGNYIDCACRQNRRKERVSPDRTQELLGDRECFESFFDALLLDAWGCTDTMLIRRRVFEEVGLFCTDLKRGHDFDMWWRIAYRYPRIGFCPEPLAVYHLDVPGSVIRRYYEASILGELIERHVQLSQRHGMAEAFRPVASHFLRLWTRGMLFNDRIGQIRPLLRRFPALTSRGWRCLMWLLTVCPPLTRWACRVLSSVVRRLRLRQSVVRSPSA